MECDHCAIKNLIYRYAHYIDNGDLESVADLFTHGKLIAGSAAGSAAETVGARAVLAQYRAFTRIYPDNGTPHTLHMTSNVVVDVAPGGERASARCYAVVFQATDGFPLQPIIGVRYYDKFDKIGGDWRFTERRIDMHLIGDLSQHLLKEPQ